MSRHRKSKRRMRLSSRILPFSAIVFLVAAVALLGYSLHKRAQDREILEQEDHLRRLFQGTACEITEGGVFLFPAASAEEAEPTAAPEIAPRFQELYGINPDVIGWITAGSEVSTAVVYRDNEYYMDHDFYGKSSAAGTVFADVLNEHWETDPYVVLYGHNMRNGAMFGNMNHYMNLNYFKQNSDICLYSIYSDEPVHYVPFAAVDASMNKEEDSYFDPAALFHVVYLCRGCGKRDRNPLAGTADGRGRSHCGNARTLAVRHSRGGSGRHRPHSGAGDLQLRIARRTVHPLLPPAAPGKETPEAMAQKMHWRPPWRNNISKQKPAGNRNLAPVSGRFLFSGLPALAFAADDGVIGVGGLPVNQGVNQGEGQEGNARGFHSSGCWSG